MQANRGSALSSSSCYSGLSVFAYGKQASSKLLYALARLQPRGRNLVMKRIGQAAAGRSQKPFRAFADGNRVSACKAVAAGSQQPLLETQERVRWWRCRLQGAQIFRASQQLGPQGWLRRMAALLIIVS
jgi:hypothetical protein